MGFTMALDVSRQIALLSRLAALEENFANGTKQISIESAERIRDTAKSLAPYDTGELRDSIKINPISDKDGGFSVSVVTDCPYAYYVEFGHFTRPGPNRRWVQPQPFLYPAYAQEQKKYINMLTSYVDNLAKTNGVYSGSSIGSVSISTPAKKIKVRSVKGTKTKKVPKSKAQLLLERYQKARKKYSNILNKFVKKAKKTISSFSRRFSSQTRKELNRLIKSVNRSARKSVHKTHMALHKSRVRTQKRIKRMIYKKIHPRKRRR